jgi:hypothetical protein
MGLVGERDLVFVLNIAVTITTLIPVFWGSIPMRHCGPFDGYQVLLLIGYTPPHEGTQIPTKKKNLISIKRTTVSHRNTTPEYRN